eukprot:TRINITY_DN67720_c3_g1_i2.p1 TRINITY_DN67720_c3_g1~~TRINITY_DN67720_c3_g1_i2.p1  ORF type:complete len:457 (+),score=52.66 TRINITY_DN67720_c3_g1_i2:22-1392(+)
MFWALFLCLRICQSIVIRTHGNVVYQRASLPSEVVIGIHTTQETKLAAQLLPFSTILNQTFAAHTLTNVTYKVENGRLRCWVRDRQACSTAEHTVMSDLSLRLHVHGNATLSVMEHNNDKRRPFQQQAEEEGESLNPPSAPSAPPAPQPSCRPSTSTSRGNGRGPWGEKWLIIAIPAVVVSVGLLLYVAYRKNHFKKRWKATNKTNSTRTVSCCVSDGHATPTGVTPPGQTTVHQDAYIKPPVGGIRSPESLTVTTTSDEQQHQPINRDPTSNNTTTPANGTTTTSTQPPTIPAPTVSDPSTGSKPKTTTTAAATTTTATTTGTGTTTGTTVSSSVSSIGGVRPPEILAAERNLQHQRAKVVALRTQFNSLNSSCELLEHEKDMLQEQIQRIAQEIRSSHTKEPIAAGPAVSSFEVPPDLAQHPLDDAFLAVGPTPTSSPALQPCLGSSSSTDLVK